MTEPDSNVPRWWFISEGASLRQVVAFQLAHQGIQYDPDLHWVDVGALKADKFTVQYRRKQATHPILSIVRNLDPVHVGFVLTSPIDMDAYKFKEIPETLGMVLSCLGTHAYMTYPSASYAGMAPLSDAPPAHLQTVHVWERDGSEMGMDACASEEQQEKATAVPFVAVAPVVDDLPLYVNDPTVVSDIIYSTNSAGTAQQLRGFLQNHCLDPSHIYCLQFKPKTQLNYTSLLNLYSKETVDDVLALNNEDITFDPTNRFARKKINQGALPTDVCYWILNESFKSKLWQKSPYADYDQYLKVESMPAVLSYLLFITNFWMMNIRKQYGLEEHLRFNVKDLFMAKYTEDFKIADKDTHVPTAGNSLVLTVQINSPTDFRNGEISFEDADSVSLIQGDMLIHPGKTKRSNGGVSSGEKLVLVYFIEINF